MAIDCNVFNFKNYGVIFSRVPTDIFTVLKDEINDILKDLDTTAYKKANKDLAGNIEKEFYLEKSKSLIEPIILDITSQYIKNFDFESKIPNLTNTPPGTRTEYELGNLWVNFQKKYEFNPLHWHSGIFSFVIWVNIPYNIDNERSIGSSKNSYSPLASTFNFVYTDVLGDILTHTMSPEKMHEGGLVLFPAKLNHQVWPFYTSDDYRITVSGNVHLKGKE